MQCTWQNIARRLASRDIARPPQLISHSNSLLRCGVAAKRRLFTTANLATHSSQTPPQFPFFSTLGRTPDVSASSLTSAQRGRAAAQAINLSIQQGNIADALHIVNSMRFTGVKPKSSKLPGLTSVDHFLPVANAFSKGVSPRLPSHTLLHGLIRQGMVNEAAKLAEQMMGAGIRVRCKTLEAVYTSLAHNSTSNPPASLPTTFSLESRDILHLRPSMSRDPGTKFALTLLSLARKSRQRRSHNMFKTLMALCLINGEIIIGSLLFGLLLRDWQARESTPDSSQTAPTAQVTPLPVRRRMQEICTFVDTTFAAGRDGEYSEIAVKESLQALANLAGVLDRQEIPFNNLTPLLCSLYNCPRVSHQVWILDKYGQPRQVQAYSYFHDVLKRLIHSLPTDDSPSRRKTMMPPLDVASYNTLLHYSLRYRRSVPLAEKLLDHMMKLRKEPLEPNTTTLNILARAGTLLRDSRIAQMALSRQQNTSLDSMKKSKKMTPEDPNTTLVAIAEGAGDNYTLTTYISNLIATGKPDIVVNAVPALLPGFDPVRYPQGPIGITFAERAALRRKYHEDGLSRAVSFGPVVFTSILNALQKCGRTGLAEKVWQWAKEAERQSWTPGPDGVVRPWCLPVQAYTIMIKLYAREARMGQYYGVTSPSVVSEKVQKVVGWGGEAGRSPRSTRSALGRRSGMDIYYSMASASHIVDERVALLHEQFQTQGTRVRIGKRQVEVPKPDARFFNAILDIVGRQPSMVNRCRIRKRSTRYFRRQLRASRHRYVWQGIEPRSEPDPALLEVANDMIALGYPIPLLYQKLLVGRWSGATPHDVDGTGKLGEDTRPFGIAGRVRDENLPDSVGRVSLRVVNTRSKCSTTRRGRKKQGAIKRRRSSKLVVD